MKSVNRFDWINQPKSVTRGKTSPGILECLHEALDINFPSVTRGILCSPHAEMILLFERNLHSQVRLIEIRPKFAVSQIKMNCLHEVSWVTWLGQPDQV